MNPDTLYRIRKADDARYELESAHGELRGAHDAVTKAQERVRRAEYANADATYELLRALKKEIR